MKKAEQAYQNIEQDNYQVRQKRSNSLKSLI